MKKKLMAIAMTAAMVGSLTACGGGAKETTAAPTEAAKTEAAETEAKAEESKEADAGSGKADGDLITVGYAQVGAESGEPQTPSPSNLPLPRKTVTS